MYKIYNQDNMTFETDQKFNFIYSDYIYNDLDLSWLDKYWYYLKPNSIFCCQTDDSSMAQMKLKLDFMPNSIWLNTCIMIQEWGGSSKRFFPRKHDYIFIYTNGENYKFHSDRIQIPKVTAGTKFDKKGTGLKTPCDVFYDLGNFSTMSKERIKDPATLKNIHWQKSKKLMERLILPMTSEGDDVLDIFMGVASLGEVCLENNRNYVGIEYDQNPYKLAEKRLHETIISLGMK